MKIVICLKMSKRGRPRLYKSEEERLEAMRVGRLRHYNNKVGKVVDEGHYGKKHIINNKDGITIKIETLNRMCINVIDMEWCITVKYVEDQELFTEVRKSVQEIINRWLENQRDWDHKNRILVWENPEYKPKGGYTPIYQYLTFELYLKRMNEPKVWADTLEEIMPLVNLLKDEIKNTCQEVGITVKYRSNPNSVKHLQKLANDAASKSTEP